MVAAARVWNSLPDLVTSAPSVADFRSQLKTRLFNISYPFPCDCRAYSACALIDSIVSGCFGRFTNDSIKCQISNVLSIAVKITLYETARVSLN